MNPSEDTKPTSSTSAQQPLDDIDQDIKDLGNEIDSREASPDELNEEADKIAHDRGIDETTIHASEDVTT